MGKLCKLYKTNLLGLIVFAFSVTISNHVHAQSGYIVFGKVSVTQGTVQGVEARLQSNNNTINLQVNDKGDFKSNLQWNQNYLFIFSKKGFIAKSIRFSTELPGNVNKNTIEPYQLLVELTPVMANVDTAFFENPVGFIRFDAQINDFDFDRDYSLKVKYSNPVQKKTSGNEKSNNVDTNQVRVKDHKTSKSKTTSAIVANDFKQTDDFTTSEPFKRTCTRPKTLYAPDFPPLLDEYPQGITREEFAVTGRKVTRVVLFENNYIKVLLKVKHDWGSTFYFINEAPDYYRGISRETFIKLAGAD